MPRYFFHFRKPGKDLQDRAGIILADAAAARQEAMLAIGGFFQRSREVVDPESQAWSIEVCDETGHCLCSLACADAARLAEHALCSPAADYASPRVVYLPVERARRQLSSEAKRARQLVERSARLVDHSRYETKTLHCLQKTTDAVRRQSSELLARSRQQSAIGRSWDTHTAARQVE
jgi:Domain of unknown function (DUF6894)